MKNMRKLLAAMTALGLTTVASINAVACGGNTATTTMPAKVLSDLGISDSNGNSQLVVSLAKNTTTASWQVAVTGGVAGPVLKATALLDATTKKAKSQDSYIFLTTNLGVKPTQGSSFSDGVFDKTITDDITFVINTVKPTLQSIENNSDFAVAGGTETGRWMKGDSKLDVPYTLNLKPAATTGLIKAGFPASTDITLANFDTTVGPLTNFVAGQTNNLIVGQNIIPSLKADIKQTDSVKLIKSLANLTNQTLGSKVKTLSIADTTTKKWAKGDTLVFNFTLGSVIIPTDYTLTVA